MALSKREVLLATVLAAIAITAIAYAHLLTGAITITRESAIDVKTPTIKIPWLPGSGGVFNRTAYDVIEIDFSKGGFQQGDKVLVRVELLPSAKAYALKALLIKFKNATSSGQGVTFASPSTSDNVAVLTLNNPYDEFVVQLTRSDAKLVLDAEVAVAAGPQVSGETISIPLSVSITGWP
jgi:hypothetical protein